VVVAPRSMGGKGSGDLPIYENMAGVDVHRFYKSLYDMFLFQTRH